MFVNACVYACVFGEGSSAPRVITRPSVSQTGDVPLSVGTHLQLLGARDPVELLVT